MSKSRTSPRSSRSRPAPLLRRRRRRRRRRRCRPSRQRRRPWRTSVRASPPAGRTGPSSRRRRGAVDEHVAGLDLDLVHLRRQPLLRSSLGPGASPSGSRACPRGCPTDRSAVCSWIEIWPARGRRSASRSRCRPAVHARPAGVLDRRVASNPDRVIDLEGARSCLEEWPPRSAVHPVADRSPGDAAVRDLHQVVNSPRPSQPSERVGSCRSRRQSCWGLFRASAPPRSKSRVSALPCGSRSAAVSDGRDPRGSCGAADRSRR